MKTMTRSDLGILISENCGKFLKIEDAPCACGNHEYFIVLDECSLLLFKDAAAENEIWEAESQGLSA